MSRRSYRANKIVSRHIDDYVDAFDTRILEDWMHTVDDGDELVTHFAEAVANAEYSNEGADEQYGYSEEITRTAERAADNLEQALADHLETLVAKRCDRVASREGEWTDNYSNGSVEEAVHEAREWLQEHHEAAERAGVFDEVSA